MQVIYVASASGILPAFSILKGDGIAGLEGHAIHMSDRLPGTIVALLRGGETIAGVAALVEIHVMAAWTGCAVTCSYSGTNTARATNRIRTWVRRFVYMRRFSPLWQM